MFFHKIVVILNNLRLLGEKVKASNVLRRGYGVPCKLSEADKFISNICDPLLWIF